jgi:hypothetical protein
MSDGAIPLNYGDLPTEGNVLNEGEPYRAELTKVALSLKRDKNNDMFCSIEVSVTEGLYEGKVLNRNYMRLPDRPKDTSEKEMIRLKDRNEGFGRFCRAFKIQGTPPDVVFGDSESYARWHDFMSQFYGNQALVTVKNEEYQGRVTSRLNDFVV